MTKAAAPKPSFADVIVAVETNSDLSETQRRDLISALRTMARLLGRDPEGVPANTEWLRQRLRQVHPRQLRVSDKRLQNVKSAVMNALRKTVANNKRHAAFPEMSDAFKTLYEAMPNRMEGYKLSRFFRYCSILGLTPSDVTDKTVAKFEAALIEDTLHKDPRGVAKEAVLTWNKMSGLVTGWPAQKLYRKPTREAWTSPLETFAESFQSDVDLWCRRLGHKDLFDENAPVRACRPATIKHRRFQIRMMASAVVRSGVPIEEIQSLADLVSVENFKRGMEFMLKRQDGQVKEANFTLASGIKAIARHHVKVDDAQLGELKRICSKLDQMADRYRKKNKDRLDQFDDPRNLAMLMWLPARLIELSQKSGPKPRSAALYAQSAVAIELLLFCPMRVGNLASLDTERHLRWIKDRGTLRLVIDIPGEEVKNDKPLRYELSGPSAFMVRDYIDGARKTLSDVPATALFPKMDGRTRNPGDLSHQIKRHCFQETGLIINAHLFRSLASKIHQLIAAGDTATISHVLGDQITTVMRAYTQFEQKTALDHYQRSVRKVRANDDDDDGSDAA